MKRRIAKVSSIVLAVVMLLGVTAGCVGRPSAPAEPAAPSAPPASTESTLDVAEIGAAIDGINADMSDFEAAADVIHVKTDVILEGDAPLSDEVLEMTEAVHMSSHAMMLLAIHMNSYIGKLDTYKADLEKNRGKILAAVGKIEALRKIFVEATTTTDFSGWMEWPYTEKSPHDTVHIILGDEGVKANPDYKSSVDAMHEAMHAFEEAGGSMRLHLEDLEDLVPPPESTLDVAEIGAAIDGINADMSDFEAAADVIHVKTDVILEGDAPLSDEVLEMTEAVHMSSHAMMLLAIHMNSYIGKLDTYKADPEKNRGKILVAVGKIEALRKIFVEATTTTDFSGWMEWPYTEKSPHDTVHIILGDEGVKANPDYKSSVDAMHEAMHAFEEAGGSMRLHLEDLME